MNMEKLHLNNPEQHFNNELTAFDERGAFDFTFAAPIHALAFEEFKIYAATNPQNYVTASLKKLISSNTSNPIEYIDYVAKTYGTKFLKQGAHDGKTLLTNAVLNSIWHKDKLYENYISKKIPANAETVTCENRHHYTLMMRCIAIAERLIDLGADVNACFDHLEKSTLLDLTLEDNYLPYTRKLIFSGAKIYKTQKSIYKLDTHSSLNKALQPLTKRLQLLPLMGNGTPLLPELIRFISGLLFKSSCSATFNFPEDNFGKYLNKLAAS